MASVNKVARELEHEVVSLDRGMPADLHIDVFDWNFSKLLVGHFNIIWASPPCETFSAAARKMIGRHGYTRETLEQNILERGVPILRRTELIIDYFQPRLWFIENPQN